MVSDYSLDRGLPASPDAERAILGAIILEPELSLEVVAKLAPEHMFLDAHRRIFRRICELSDAGKPIDTLTVAEELIRNKELEAVGGAGFLASLTEGVPRRTSLDHYIRIIREKWMLRTVTHAASSALSRATDGSESAEEILGDLEGQLLELRAERQQRAEAKLDSFIISVADRLQETRTSDLVGFTTGLQCIDHATTGIRRGEFWVVGALPGRGKTAFGMQVAVANAMQGFPTLFFSLEMSREQLGERMLAPESGIAPKIIRKRVLNSTQKSDVVHAAQRMCAWSLYVDDSAELTNRELMARARLAIRRYGVGLFIVDYLRLVRCQGGDIRERVSEAANTLRTLAKQENVAVVGLSQLRRPQEINDRPSMIDLKESGDIEAHAHTVLLLYQPLDKEGAFTHADEIIIGKQRNGPVGSEPVYFDPESLTFRDRDVTR